MQTETIVFGGGCFWCTEAIFKELRGVISAEPGYSGGSVANPTYEQVSAGDTGHIEVAKIAYDPEALSFEALLKVFFATHDPTTPNRQGNDFGPQYQSAVFYTTNQQKVETEQYVAQLGKTLSQPIITRILPLEKFYPAEDYHKNYFEHHKDAPYCELIIAPKIEKVHEKFGELVKKS